MTADELRAWQHKVGLRTDRAAAKAVALSVRAYRRQRNGRSPVRPQTALLASQYEILSAAAVLKILGACRDVIEALPEVPPAISNAVTELAAKVTIMSTSGP